jgi:hypothetical protein
VRADVFVGATSPTVDGFASSAPLALVFSGAVVARHLAVAQAFALVLAGAARLLVAHVLRFFGRGVQGEPSLDDERTRRGGIYEDGCIGRVRFARSLTTAAAAQPCDEAAARRRYESVS